MGVLMSGSKINQNCCCLLRLVSLIVDRVVLNGHSAVAHTFSLSFPDKAKKLVFTAEILQRPIRCLHQQTGAATAMPF